MPADLNFVRLAIFDSANLFDEFGTQHGVYVAAMPASGSWRGCDLYMSCDSGTEYDFIGGLPQAVGGFNVTALASGPTTIVDLTNEIDAHFTSGTPASMTAFVPEKNYLVVGSELLQFKTATLVNTGNYTLSNLQRGLKGTAVSGHVIGESIFIVNRSSVKFIPIPATLVGDDVYFKAVPEGVHIDDVLAQSLTYAGGGITPIPPGNVTYERDDSDNITVFWDRFTRATVPELSGANGPIFEENELYILDIASGTRVVEVFDASEYEYTAAMQTADGLTPGNPVDFDIVQRGMWTDSSTVSITAS